MTYLSRSGTYRHPSASELLLIGTREAVELVVQHYQARAAILTTMCDAEAQGDNARVDRLSELYDSHPVVTALQALEATQKLMGFLMLDRTTLATSARVLEAATWEDVGRAMGVSKQAAQSWHSRETRARATADVCPTQPAGDVA